MIEANPVLVPKSFYKYRPLDDAQQTNADIRQQKLIWLKETILEGKVHWSSPQAFNDPFDCAPVFKRPDQATFTDYINRLVAKKNPLAAPHVHKQLAQFADESCDDDFMAELAQKVRDDLANTAIFSLAVSPCDILMWSHYANAHKGVCLRMNSAVLTKSFPAHGKVRYSEDRPHAMLGSDGPMDLLEKILFTKAKKWEYENEWRYIAYGEKPGCRTLPENCLTGVILGYRIDQSDEEEITKWVDERADDIALYKAVVDAEHFAIKLEPINPAANKEAEQAS